MPAFSADDEAFADDMLRAMLSEGEDPQDPRLQQQQPQLPQQAAFAMQQQQQLMQHQQELAAQQLQLQKPRDPYQQQQAPPRYQQPQDPGHYGGPALSTFIPDPSAELHRQVCMQALHAAPAFHA